MQKSGQKIVVTGMGVFCPLGRTLEELIKNLRDEHCAIGPIQALDTSGLKIQHAAEIVGYEPSNYFNQPNETSLDRSAQFGILAALQALEHANVKLSDFKPERVALVVGICAGGQTGIDAAALRDGRGRMEDSQKLFADAQYAQTDAIGDLLGIHGPRITLSTACASSGTALSYAYEVLESGKADLVLAGGADPFSASTYAGFYALGAMAPQPCAPFSEPIGVTFGEGAGFVVLERLDDANRRSTSVYGELAGYGVSADAHHITSPHPAGEGLCRAMQSALSRAGIKREEIDYINAHGTGTRDNDTAETMAIRQLFQGADSIPPVSSTKSYFGHTLGAAGVLEFIVSLLCAREQILPPTLNFVQPRHGCDLDYIPNHVRSGNVRYFLSNSAAFGGVNAVLLGSPRLNPQHSRPSRRGGGVCVTGLGTISSIGLGVEEFAESLRNCRSGFELIDRFDTTRQRAKKAGLVKNLNPKRLAAALDVRRLDALNQYAGVASGLAFRDACLEVKRIPEERLGVVVGLTRGPVSTQKRFMESLEHDGLENLSAKYFPAMVVSTVAGQVAQLLRIKGLSSTVVDGATAGLQALIHAFEILRLDDSLDAIVVVAADEVGSLNFRAFDEAGMLATADTPMGEALCPYDGCSAGTILGEGAAALVLERTSSALARGARVYADIKGSGQTADACNSSALEPEGKWLTQAMEVALDDSGLAPSDLAAIYGHGRGLAAYDAREARAIERLLGGRVVPVSCVVGNTGLAEASCGTFTAAAATLSMRNGEIYPIATTGSITGDLDFVRDKTRLGEFRHSMIAGSTEHGNNAALIFSRH
jgi:3-oxoacyl-[acyl-carrier-protein] synthase II